MLFTVVYVNIDYSTVKLPNIKETKDAYCISVLKYKFHLSDWLSDKYTQFFL